ncbi:unnamed protein product, partial [marine sediment metagenome]
LVCFLSDVLRISSTFKANSRRSNRVLSYANLTR